MQVSNPLCQIHTVRLWLKAFIPKEIEGAKPIPAGPHKGKTMLTSPGPINAWFLTDERDFSAEPDAQARMHSEIELDFANFQVIRQSHRCSPTIQVNPETGEEECHEIADTEQMSFEDVKMLPGMQTITMHLKGSTKNACLKVAAVKVSPNLDYDGEINLRLHKNQSELVVSFTGQIETYPAFEMYVMINKGKAVPIFQMPVEADATPLSLIGGPQRSVNVSTTIACQTAD